MKMNSRRYKIIQSFLILAGFHAGGRLIGDGEWGDVSIEAMRAYQHAHGLTVTGTVTTQSLDHIQKQTLKVVRTRDLRHIEVQAYIVLEDLDRDNELIVNGEDQACYSRLLFLALARRIGLSNFALSESLWRAAA